MLLNLYVNAKYCVNWNHKQSNTFTVQNGVKQGGVTSPLLFTIFVEELIERVKNSKLGCYVGDKCASILVFADDVLLLCPTRSSTQSLLNICKNFADEVGLKFNIGKCKYILFGLTGNVNIHIYLGNTALERVNQEMHIGNKLSNIGDVVIFEDIIKGIAVKTNCLKRIFDCVDSQCKCVLFNAQCCNMYGIELIDITSPQFDKLQVQWRKSIRYLVNLHPRTHNDLLPHIVGSPNAQSLVYSRIICFFRKGLKHDSDYIEFFFKNCLINMHSYMCKNVNVILRKIGITINDILTKSETWLKKICKRVDPPDWKNVIVNELIRCRDGTMECGLSNEEINMLLLTLCIE